MARKPCGGRHHVLLRYAALEEAIGEGELERANAAVRRKVGVENDEVLVLDAEPNELFPVRIDDVLSRRLLACAGSGFGLAFERAFRMLVHEIGRLEDEAVEPEGAESISDSLVELGERARERFVVRRARVPAVGAAAFGERDRMLHERHAFPLDRPCDQCLGSIVHFSE